MLTHDKAQLHGKSLSARELQIVQIISLGKSNKEIGAQLGLKEGSVKVYVSRIIAKLGLDSRLKIALWVVGGIGSPAMIPPPPSPRAII